MRIFSPTTLTSDMEKGGLPSQRAALEIIMTGLERYERFDSEGRVYLGWERALPVFRLIASHGWHVLWAKQWGENGPLQPNGKDVRFIVAATEPAGFTCAFLAAVKTAYRVTPGKRLVHCNPNDRYEVVETDLGFLPRDKS